MNNFRRNDKRHKRRYTKRYSNYRRCAIEQFESRLALSVSAGGDHTVGVLGADGAVDLQADRFALFDAFDGTPVFGGDLFSDGLSSPSGSPSSPTEQPTQEPNSPPVFTGSDTPGESLRPDEGVVRGTNDFQLDDLSVDEPVSNNLVLGPKGNSLDEPFQTIVKAKDVAKATLPSVGGGEPIALKLLSLSEEPLGPYSSLEASTHEAAAAESLSSASAVADSAETVEDVIDRPQARAMFLRAAATRGGDSGTTGVATQQPYTTAVSAVSDWLVRRESQRAEQTNAQQSGMLYTVAAYTTALDAEQDGGDSTGAVAHALPKGDVREPSTGYSEQPALHKTVAVQSVDHAFDSWQRGDAMAPSVVGAVNDQNRQVGLAMAIAALVAVDYVRYTRPEKSASERPRQGALVDSQLVDSSKSRRAK